MVPLCGMNSRQRATLEAIFVRPPRHDMRWSDIESLFRALGTVVEKKGSAVGIRIGDVAAVFHRPHPRPEIRRKTIADIRDFLERAGVKP